MTSDPSIEMLSEDFLPQPYRFVNKIVQGLVSDAMEEIGRRLERGFIADKQLVLPPPTKALVLQQRVLSPIPGADADCPRPTSQRTAVAHDNGVNIEGFASGEAVVTSRFEGTVYRRGPVVPAEGAVVAVALVAPRDANPTFAAGTSSSVMVTTVDVTEPAKPGEEMQLLLHITADMLQRKSVASITISPDAAFVAVALSDSTEVAVFAIVPEQAGAPPLTAAAYNSALYPAVDRVRALCGFFCDRPSRPLLGYHREAQQRRPLAHTLCIAWEGANVLTRLSLREFNQAIAASHEAARRNLQLFVTSRAEQAVSPTGGGKDSKAKGAAAAKGKEVAQAAEVVSPSPVSGAALPTAYDGRRDALLAEAITCLVVDGESRSAAIGCRNGVVHIESSEGPIQSFRCAPHRAHTMCKRLMYCSSIFFVPNRRELVVTHSTYGSPNGTMAAVINLAEPDPKKKLLYTQHHLPESTFAAVPCGQLPLVLYFVEGRIVVADKQSSNILTEVRIADVSSWPSVKSAPANYNLLSDAAEAARDHVSRVQQSVVVGEEEIEVRWVDPVSASAEKVVGISMYELVFGLYPLLRELLGGIPIETIAKLLDKAPHPIRGDRAALAAIQMPATASALGGATAVGTTTTTATTITKRGSTLKSSKSGAAGPTSPTRELLDGPKKILPVSASVEEKIAWVLHQREDSRMDRKARMKVLFEALDSTLK